MCGRREEQRTGLEKAELGVKEGRQKGQGDSNPRPLLKSKAAVAQIAAAGKGDDSKFRFSFPNAPSCNAQIPSNKSETEKGDEEKMKQFRTAFNGRLDNAWRVLREASQAPAT